LRLFALLVHALRNDVVSLGAENLAPKVNVAHGLLNSQALQSQHDAERFVRTDTHTWFTNARTGVCVGVEGGDVRGWVVEGREWVGGKSEHLNVTRPRLR
jgi:hypothetical protein